VLVTHGVRSELGDAAPDGAPVDQSQLAANSMSFWKLVALHVAVGLTAQLALYVLGRVFFKRRLKRV